jgi:hypothetical protein
VASGSKIGIGVRFPGDLQFCLEKGQKSSLTFWKKRKREEIRWKGGSKEIVKE